MIAPNMAGDRMQFDQLKRREFITLLGGARAGVGQAADHRVPRRGSCGLASMD
jgi:hypothetical protein